MKHENDLHDLNQWADQYQAAIEHGVFDDAPKPPSPTPQTADVSFFGPVDTDPTDAATEADSEYWQRLHETMSGLGGYADPLELSENTGEVKSDAAAKAQAIAQSPNPVKPGSIGMDQDVHDPASTGQTYSQEDLEQLEELKVQLHDLESKLNAFDTEGKKTTGLEKRLTRLKKRINDMSDDMGHSLPDQMES